LDCQDWVHDNCADELEKYLKHCENETRKYQNIWNSP